jgi:hypothetical protein
MSLPAYIRALRLDEAAALRGAQRTIKGSSILGREAA